MTMKPHCLSISNHSSAENFSRILTGFLAQLGRRRAGFAQPPQCHHPVTLARATGIDGDRPRGWAQRLA